MDLSPIVQQKRVNLSEVEKALFPYFNFTTRDWQRWDGFDYTSVPVQRASHGYQALTGKLTNPLTFSEEWYLMFRDELIRNFLAYERQAFLWLRVEEGSVDDYLSTVRKTGALPVQEVLRKVSFTLGQSYQSFKEKKWNDLRYQLKVKLSPAELLASTISITLDRKTNELFDQSPVNFRTLNPDIVKWLEDLFTTHLSYQVLDSSITLPRSNPNDYRGKEWRPYGHWYDKANNLYNPDLLQWQVADYAYLYGHYLHLLSDRLIRGIRRSARAVLGALYQQYLDLTTLMKDPNLANFSTLESQWLLSISGFIGYTFVLQRSQQELTERGVWGAYPEDQFYEDPLYSTQRQEKRVLGQWSLAEATTHAELLAQQFADRVQQKGFVEYLGAYSRYHIDYMVEWLLHPPSQKVYDLALAVWKETQWDLVLHFHPASASFSGTSGRTYDQYSGFHNYYDRYDHILYYKHLFVPKEKVLLQSITGGIELRATLNLEQQQEVFYLNPSYTETEHSLPRLLYHLAQLGGEGFLPDQYLEHYTLNVPSRINQLRFTEVKGQERYSFLTPDYVVAHSGENYYALPYENTIVCRLAGGKGPVNNLTMRDITYASPASSYLSFILTNKDNPFARPNGEPYGPAGNNLGRLMRTAITQYQGQMLITELIAPTGNSTSEELVSAPWITQVILPLSGDSLEVNGLPLPITPSSLSLEFTEGLIVSARQGTAGVVLRLLYYEELQGDPLTVKWVVDSDSLSCGCGRLSLIHRSAQSSTKITPLRMAWLLSAGSCPDDASFRGLVQRSKEALYSKEETTSGVWDPQNQPHDRYPDNNPSAPTGEVGSLRWISKVVLKGLTLTVDRTDVYLPWNNSPVYRTPYYAPLYALPYYLKNLSRQVNGEEIMVWDKAEAYRSSLLGEVFAPHLDKGAVLKESEMQWSYH